MTSASSAVTVAPYNLHTKTTNTFASLREDEKVLSPDPLTRQSHHRTCKRESTDGVACDSSLCLRRAESYSCAYGVRNTSQDPCADDCYLEGSSVQTISAKLRRHMESKDAY